MDRVRVAVQAADPITLAGLVSCLKPRAELFVVPSPADADVVVFAADRVSAQVLADLRLSAQQVSVPRVLVANELDPSDVLRAVEARVVAVLPRIAATGTRLINSVVAAARGGAVMPPDLLGELLKQVDHLQREVLTPRGLNASGLTSREVDVLRLMADGLDTVEIAEKLCYSERTVKNVIYGVTNRLNLRNRPHAVAFAMRAGAI
ncbi:DNA-binding response regulator, NarL/FixJ family, contains REC and HTH domains [Saccharopolyspora shandongensis]|uniref:DNA-binding response regulator, NarL/FixJ family, contains REC and HTH domains n=1 Tax=Saccharopolyspora shandongensis TaxID=418495 RepID=A0A1H3SXS2_9PSEU|nr:response regulator transcription factor [Saccharopolyspora shandongensis]SDZ42826.1 DNA-binding response regulator, NarL/FixJ family, contains REC and HTH domains [Saccharopolyspora shandongensis]